MNLNDVLIFSLRFLSKLRNNMGAGQSRVKEGEVEKLPQYTIMGGSAKFKGYVHLNNDTSEAAWMRGLNNA